MIPDEVRKKVEDILRDEDSPEQGNEIVIEDKGNDIYYGYVKNDGSEPFEHLYINGKTLSFLYDTSTTSPDVLFERFSGGIRSSVPRQDIVLRRDVLLPVIEDEVELHSFAKELTEAFISLEKGKESDDKLYKLIYNSLILLLSTREKGTKLIFLASLYHKPTLVRSYLRKVMDRDVYDYWTQFVPKFMEREDSAQLIYNFDIIIVSLIGEQKIQDLCNNYKSVES